ncbi:helix-turn-helix domain-containing protein [Kitasatospora sp. NPDC101801]|uniref:helix-turn-helix domain-containing protein n=1 Tax=Kitasatospora sp. NPDC101801 TaxID=3364103 RepID=UPI003821B003
MTQIELDRQLPGGSVHNSTLVGLAAAVGLLREMTNGHPGELLWMGSGDWAGSPLPGLVRQALAGPGRPDRLLVLIDGACRVAEVAPWLDEPEPDRVTVRTARRLPHDLLIVDRHAVLVPAGGGADEPLLAVVREPVSVRTMRGLFGTVWGGAAARGELSEPVVLGEDDVKQRILELLAEGAKDAVIARKLGVSLRTCRRHVAEILLELGAVSRFQAGAAAARLGLVAARRAVCDSP